MNRAENDKVIHFPVRIRPHCDMIMQVSVPVETNKITPSRASPEVHRCLRIPAEVEVLVTLDAVRIWREAARDKEGKRLDYLMNVQKPARVAAFAKIAAYPGRAWRRYHRARGRITKRSC